MVRGAQKFRVDNNEEGGKKMEILHNCTTLTHKKKALA